MTQPTESPTIKLLSLALSAAHAALVAVILLAISYFFGHSILDGRLQGSDSPLHLGYAVWLDQYFPHLPHWYPLQGGGASILHGYPLLAHLTVVLVHRLSGLSILQTFRLVSFATFPLTAFGIYLLAWSILRRKTIGLVAAVFYLVSPITWTWMYNWGFFAQQVALVFLPPALFAFDRTLHHQLEGARSGRGRLWFTALIVFLVVGSLCHMLVAAAAAVGFVLLVLLTSLTAPGPDRLATLRGGFKIIALLGVVAGLVIAGYFVPFYAYGRIANREGLNTPPESQLHRLPIAEFFGLKAIDPLEILTRMQFPILVTGFAVIGLLAAFLFARRRLPWGARAWPLGLALMVSVVFTLSPGLVAIVLRASPFLVQFVNFRSALILTMILMPLTGAFGAWALAWALLHPRLVLGLASGTSEDGGVVRKAFARVGVSVTTLLVAGACIFPGGAFAAATPGKLSYGPLTEGFDLGDVWETGVKENLTSQLALSNWPLPTLNDSDPNVSNSMALAAQLPSDRPLRIDVSPYQGRLAMDLTAYAGVSQINAYTYTTSLVHAMWGYQQNVFYSRETPVNESGNPSSVNGLADWFGTQFVFVRSTDDPVETYQAAGWELVYEDGDLQIWRVPHAPPMATATTRPTILIVGQPATDAYMTVFRLANDGMLPYNEALLVEGQPDVDKYSLEELKPFDAVFLYGYDYKDGHKAWDMLSAYVEQGGSLFVDTGWEFWIPEWAFEDAPDVLPLDRLVWTDYGPATTYELGAPDVAGGVDVAKFKPLIWEGEPWTLSGADAADVRDWGRIVLAAGGRPLVVAGEYGKGKVVWSGMNLIGHARYGDPNREEILFLGNLIRWLTGGKSAIELPAPIVDRVEPDRVGLSFATVPGDVTWLYWREAYYPDWHATLTDGSGEREVPIYRGGPGFMLMPVDSNSGVATVRMEWVPSLPEQASIFVSAIGVLLLAALFLDGLLLSGNGFTWLRIALAMRMPSPILDEEANLEMAEAQKAQLEGRRKGLRLGRGHPDPASPPRSNPPEWMSPASGRPAIEERPEEQGPRVGSEGEQEALLQSWLDSSGHADDAWAARLIEKKQTRLGPKARPQR